MAWRVGIICSKDKRRSHSMRHHARGNSPKGVDSKEKRLWKSANSPDEAEGSRAAQRRSATAKQFGKVEGSRRRLEKKHEADRFPYEQVPDTDQMQAKSGLAGGVRSRAQGFGEGYM